MDANGLPLPGVTLRLFREERRLKTTTNADGHYTFSGLPAGSYKLCPELRGCRFLPRDVDLDHLNANTTEQFGGSGPSCGGQATVNQGATSGSLTISGHLRDASGRAIVGGRVDLHGCTRAIRFTDVTGGYNFHVNPGEYELRVSGACNFTPSDARKDVYMNVVQDFTAGDGCTTASQSNAIATGSVFTLREGDTVLGITYVSIEQRSGPADALARLREIAMEQASRSLTIAGFPAIERQTLVTRAPPALEGRVEVPNTAVTALTAAIAVGSTVVRYETQLPSDVTSAIVSRFFQLNRNFTPEALPELHGAAPPPVPTIRFTPPSRPTDPGSLVSAVAPGLFGELQIAASDIATAVVYGTQNGPYVSFDGGQTVNKSLFNTAFTPTVGGGAVPFTSGGDPTVAVGAPVKNPNGSFSQSIYFAQLQLVTPAPPGGGKPIAAVGLYQSTTDNDGKNLGKNFFLTSFPINCATAINPPCALPDRPQLAADRVNRVGDQNQNSDQLYLAWREFQSQTPNSIMRVVVACSRDGGQTWNNVDRTTMSKATRGIGDFPQLSVDPKDGSLLVVYAVYNPFPTNYALTVQRWSSCAKGFQTLGGPSTVVANVTEVTDMPGLDRAPNGNYAAAFDDADSSSNVFVVYANETSAGNDDILVVESRDGGTTWPPQPTPPPPPRRSTLTVTAVDISPGSAPRPDRNS
jgi:hypothetical protein